MFTYGGGVLYCGSHVFSWRLLAFPGGDGFSSFDTGCQSFIGAKTTVGIMHIETKCQEYADFSV